MSGPVAAGLALSANGINEWLTRSDQPTKAWLFVRGSESVRMRNEDRTALDPGDYEVVITVDNVEVARITVTIEG